MPVPEVNQLLLVGKSCLLQLLPNINNCRSTEKLLGISIAQAVHSYKSGSGLPSGKAKLTELFFQPEQQWCCKVLYPCATGMS